MGVAATMAAIVARPPSIALLGKQTQRHRWVLGPLAFSSISSSSNSPSKPRKLVLYSKPGCCLCDGLKEKLQAAFLLSGSESLHDVDLQVRDITTNPDWQNAYQYEIPVLARLLSDGTEEILPRLSPRLGVELIQKKISSALRE
ncbi:hypothetical protein LWI29_030087 [Acer saccharum]|uniref:Glutaredoxin-like protein n=1 Tax=Acer saccharum TaxID=4024 RepID=A0AA39VEH5_ACESA|nr:hypothetical protein LWI29_030087 [Acer saccharum]